MSRTSLILLTALVLVMSLLGPIGSAGAAPDDPPPAVVPESETGSYVVVMQADPLVVTEGADNLNTPAAERKAEQLIAEQDEALDATGIGADDKVNEYTAALNGFSATISQAQAEKLAARKDVALVVPDEMRQVQTDASPDFLGLTRKGGAYDSGVTGEGVVVGVIDTGIWPEHPSFADDGNYPEPDLAGDAQDPDQTFDPDDGFSDAHTFELSGAAHLRVAIPPEATEPEADLDVYVFNPDGELVAESTAGGTDEQIDITLPQDGTWTVHVHGWTAPGGDSPYTMYTWVVSATPGGNLTIDSAPTSATIGETATIEASWTDATAGQWHLGAVSHSDADGLIGLTLVNVDNRVLPP